MRQVTLKLYRPRGIPKITLSPTYICEEIKFIKTLRHNGDLQRGVQSFFFIWKIKIKLFDHHAEIPIGQLAFERRCGSVNCEVRLWKSNRFSRNWFENSSLTDCSLNILTLKQYVLIYVKNVLLSHLCLFDLEGSHILRLETLLEAYPRLCKRRRALFPGCWTFTFPCRIPLRSSPRLLFQTSVY